MNSCILNLTKKNLNFKFDMSSKLLPEKKFAFMNDGVKQDLDNLMKELNVGSNNLVVLEKTSSRSEFHLDSGIWIGPPR